MKSKNVLGNQIAKKSRNTLNVCFFSHSAELNGAERTLLELVTELIKDYGAVCTIILPKDGPLKERLEQIEAFTRIIDYSWWYDQKILPDEQITEMCINSTKNLLYSLKQMLHRINPDIIVTNTMSIPWGAIAASFLGKPHVWFIHEFGESDQDLKTFLPLDVTLEVIKNLSAMILTNSDAVRKELFPDMGEEKVLTVYQHINIPPTALYQNKNNYFTRTNSTKLIISASAHEGKGQKDAILAVKELLRRGKDVELIIMGHCTSQYAEYLKAIVKQKGLKDHIKFIGFKENPYPIMNQVDIGLVCSRNEAFGRVTVESMLLKKPVIGTNRGGTPELIKEGFNGLLYEPGDHHQLADKIEYLIDHPDETKRLAENGYEFARKTFTRNEFGGKIYQLLLNLTTKASPKASFSGLSLEGPALLDSLLTAAACKDQKITALITELGSSLRLKDSRITELTNNLQYRNTQISGLESNLQEKETQINNLEFQIQQIQQSILMQLASRYHRIMEKLLRPGTRRRHYYELGLTGIRVILNKGWRSFFRKARDRFTYNPTTEQKPFLSLPKFNTSISKKEANKLVFPAPSKKPETSIIIPAFNNWQYTLNCLKSIAENTDDDYEVLVINDASTDETAKILSNVKNLNLLKNKRNVGFIGSCNRGARASKGKYILFLNNDTMVTKGWLPPLLELIKRKDVGAVGCKLVYPDGALQEAGGIIWNDGSGWNYGRGDNPDKPEYNYIREVDYCSGASLMVKRELFEKIGGFDERFKPGYYEDTDLCFAIRNLGYRVMYQPLSTVIHFEGLVCGTDIHIGIKKYQEINKSKFAEKCKSILQNCHHNPGQDNVFLARERCSDQRVLVVDHHIPTHDKDSGSLRMFNMLQLLHELGHKVTFIGYNFTARLEPYTRELQQKGIEVIYAPYFSSTQAYIERFGRYFNVVILSRAHVAINIINLVKKNCPRARIIFDTVDLVFLRESRRAEIENDEGVAKQAEDLKKRELYLAQNSDITFVVSPVEKEILLKENASLTVEVVSNIHRVALPQKPFSKRKHILFVGSFTHIPNVDAVIFFAKEILPRVKQRIKDVRFYIVGGDPPKEILSLQDKSIIVTGHIGNLLPYFENSKLSVAPLRYGAGIKGKINQSMSYGVPVVTTSVGAEGMKLINGENALIADDPDEFADKVVLLYNDENLWSKLSRNSIENVKKNFSPEVAKEKLANVFHILKKNRPRASIKKGFSITLIQCPGWGRETPPLAIALLAGNLRSKGYKVHLFDLNNEFYHIVSEKYKRFWHAEEHRFWRSEESVKEMMGLYDADIETETKKILEKGSHLVGFSVYDSSLMFTLEIAKRIKKHSPDTLIVLGGPETTEDFGSGLKLLENPAIDAIVLREGDETLPQICADLRKKGYFMKIPGLVFKKGGRIINGGEKEPIKSLDAIPFPDYSNFALNTYEQPGRLDIISSRGCINKCHFCTERNYFQHFSFRSGESLFEEVKYHLSIFPDVWLFHFSDSLLNGVPRKIQRFSELLLENNIRIEWEGQAIIRKEMTSDLLKKMAKAGCRILFYGVESGSDKVLRSMNKGVVTTELAARVLKNTHEAGIKSGVNFMIGYPTETEEDFQMTLDFVRKNHEWIDAIYASHSFTAIGPNTYLYKNQKEFGVEGAEHHPIFWSSQNGKNTYPVRFERYKRFCKLCLELGLGSPTVTKERQDKWKYLGKYYQYKEDYQRAIDCYSKDILKHGYSPESAKGLSECYALSRGKELTHQPSCQEINKLISLHDKRTNAQKVNSRGASRIMEKLLRPGTRRNYYYKLVSTGIRVILNEGWPSFWRKLQCWSSSQRNLQKFIWIFQNEPKNEPKKESHLYFDEAIAEINQSIEKEKFKNFLALVDKFKTESYNMLHPEFGNSGAKILLLKITNLLVAKYEYFHRHTYLLSYPVTITIDPARGCNLRCPGCFPSDGSVRPHGNLTMQHYKKFIDEYGPYAVHINLFMGGEPLLNKLTPEFIKIATRYLLETKISTNFSLKNIDIENLVSSNLYLLTLSIDGASKETYSIYRRGGDFDLVLENIRRIVSIKKKLNSYMPLLEWQYLVFQHNNHELKKAEILARNLGVNLLRLAKPDYWNWEDPSILIDHTFKEKNILYYWNFNNERDYFYKLLSDLNNEVIERHFSRGWSERYDQAKKYFSDVSHNTANPTCKWLYKSLTMEATGTIIPCCQLAVEGRNLVHSHIEKAHKDSIGIHNLFNSDLHVLSRLYFKDKKAYKAKTKHMGVGEGSYCPVCYDTQGRKNKINTSPEAIKHYLNRYEILSKLSKQSKDILAY